jgi:predicted RNase H-like HicB family nuclease
MKKLNKETRTETTPLAKKAPDEYLKEPYARILMPEEDGTYTAEILEFPGCLAQGETATEAFANLEEAARSWIAASLAHGQEIPNPTTIEGFSGRVALRLPRGLHRQASILAKRDGTSLNQFVVTAVASHVGAENFAEVLGQRWVGWYMDLNKTQEFKVSTYSLTFAQTNIISHVNQERVYIQTNPVGLGDMYQLHEAYLSMATAPAHVQGGSRA